MKFSSKKYYQYYRGEMLQTKKTRLHKSTVWLLALVLGGLSPGINALDANEKVASNNPQNLETSPMQVVTEGTLSNFAGPPEPATTIVYASLGTDFNGLKLQGDGMIRNNYSVIEDTKNSKFELRLPGVQLKGNVVMPKTLPRGVKGVRVQSNPDETRIVFETIERENPIDIEVGAKRVQLKITFQ